MFFAWMVAAFLLGGGCVGAAVTLFAGYRRRRADHSSAQRMSAIVEDMNQILQSAEESDNFSLRCHNDLLRPCWEYRQCGREDCEAYGNFGVRCWHLGRPLCHDLQDFRQLFERTRHCEACPVYLQARRDVEHRFIEQFNDVMAILDYKSKLLKEARNRVEESSRLASIGEFAAGLAHEINNPLDGIMSCMARLERQPENLAQNIEYLRMIRDALNRLCGATQQLLEYARKHEIQREFLDVHTAIEHAVAFMGMRVRQNAIDIKFDLDNAVPLIQGDRHALTQVFLNLLINAVGAITEARDKNRDARSTGSEAIGEILFRTRTIESGDKRKEFVEVSVTDDGIGIPAEHIKRIFEPFFTTKGPGKGTGMGLTIVKRIVEEHGGAIAVESEPGKGTAVRIALPVRHGAKQTISEGK